MESIDFKNALNEEQLAAVEAPDGPVLVIAAAGTGKTRTLTYRVAYLVQRGIDPQRILLLTFTNRAAKEMLTRAEALVGRIVGNLWGGTFHHMANRILRRYAGALGYGLDYTIFDQDDARRLVRACSDELDLTGKHFPKPDVLLGLFSLGANMEKEVRELAEDRFSEHDIGIDDILKVHALYESRKKELNAMDFDDLLVNGVKLFRSCPDILARYQERFQYVLVDEYQDTNTIQAELVDTVASKNRNLLVVGDDFQSIYSWRGADYRNILGFPDRYPETQIIKLETNYRSVPEVLDVANACIAGNPEQFQKTLRAVRPACARPQVVRLRDGRQQAKFVIQQIRERLLSGQTPKDVAVLYRSHFHAMELQLELAREGMPYVITSGVRFFEQAHVKDACTVLRLIRNAADELAFLRLLELFPRVGKRTAAKIWDGIGRRFDPLQPMSCKTVGERLPKIARPLWETMTQQVFIDYADEKLGAGPGGVIEAFLSAFYDQYAVETFDNYERRQEDLQELVTFSNQFETVDDFLNEMALLTNLDTEAGAGQAMPEDSIRLSTIHQAKGLEWKTVFILWVADMFFPSGRSLNDAGGEAEERRLFYVATTRAKDELMLCIPQMRRNRDGSVQFCEPSRFVSELDASLFSVVDPEYIYT